MLRPFLLSTFLAAALLAQVPDLPQIAATPALWPREVTLRAPVTVPVVIQGRAAGSAVIPAGRALRVLKVETTSVTLDYNGSSVAVLPSQTDLIARVMQASGTRPAPPVAAVAPLPSPIAAASPSLAMVAPAASSVASALPVTPGWHRKIRLPELPSSPQPINGVKAGLDPAAEEWDLFLPRGFDPKKPAGLIVYVSPAPNPDIPERYVELWDQHGLIVIGAYRSANEQPIDRRAGLAVSAQLALRRHYAIDPRRVFVSGMSGGGRMSTRLGLMAPQYFKGVLAFCGADYYKDYPVTQRTAQGKREWQGRNWTAIPPGQQPAPAAVVQARAETRFVLLSGPEDTARNHEDWVSVMKADGFKTLLVMEPSLGHDFCSVDSYRRGLEFVLGLSK